MIGTFIGKSIYRIEKLFKLNASSFPGKVVLKLFPNYLKKIKYPDNIIMVTGSSGKGSTTKIICEILENNGLKVCSNKEGSNLLFGVATAITQDTKGKKLKSDALVLEVDERYLKIITKHIKPKYVLVNNITRDQPPRQGSFEIVFNEILKGLDKDTHLVVNGDDPILRKFSLIHKGPITYYGINKTKYSYKKQEDIKDYEYCPNCKNKLIYDYYHYGSVGNYKCSKCDFKRDDIKYSITDVDYKNNKININDEYEINISNTILFNLYNSLAAFAVTDLLKIDSKVITNTLENSKITNKIFEEFTVNKRTYTILNCKAENNATYNLNLIYTAMNEEKKTIVLGLREISRRYNHFDLSWLYDIYFEILKESNIDKVICAGPYRYDFATRLKYAGINEKDIIIIDNLDNIKETVEKHTKGNIYAILNFDYVDPFKNKIKEETK